jgi:hypothetical protein
VPPTRLGWPAALAVLASCNVTAPHTDRGGADAGSGVCGRGVVVVASDYRSVNVALLDPTGAVLSRSLVSSGSASAELSAPLSGDTVVPTMPARGDDVVLIDRFPNSVLSWVNVRTGRVTSQLSVASGFAANPHDYAAVSATKGYVTRFERNGDSGAQQHDEGSDVLIVDPSVPAITGRVDLMAAMQGESAEFEPHPSSAVVVNERLYVVLAGYNRDYTASAESRIVAIDTATDRVVETLLLAGLHGCGGLSISPEETELAVGCLGELDGNLIKDQSASAIAVIRTAPVLEEKQRFESARFGPGPVSGAVQIVSDERLLFTTFGNFSEPPRQRNDDQLVELERITGTYRVLLRSSNKPFTLGGLRCQTRCGVCFLADAGADAIQRLALDEEGRVSMIDRVELADGIGLPPRYLGAF